MGCCINQSKIKITKSTAIEIIDIEDYNKNCSGIDVAKFRTNGQEIKVHFRILGSKAHTRST